MNLKSAPSLLISKSLRPPVTVPAQSLFERISVQEVAERMPITAAEPWPPELWGPGLSAQTTASLIRKYVFYRFLRLKDVLEWNRINHWIFDFVLIKQMIGRFWCACINLFSFRCSPYQVATANWRKVLQNCLDFNDFNDIDLLIAVRYNQV